MSSTTVTPRFEFRSDASRTWAEAPHSVRCLDCGWRVWSTNISVFKQADTHACEDYLNQEGFGDWIARAYPELKLTPTQKMLVYGIDGDIGRGFIFNGGRSMGRGYVLALLDEFMRSPA